MITIQSKLLSSAPDERRTLAEGHRGTLADTTIRTDVYFDTSEAETNFLGQYTPREVALTRFSVFHGDSVSVEDIGLKVVFLLPIRLMHARSSRRRTLSGLLLLPTAKEKGKFTRVGQFDSPDEDSSLSDFEYMSSSTHIVDEKFFLSKEGSGDRTEYAISIV
jgi:hypothetical protein